MWFTPNVLDQLFGEVEHRYQISGSTWIGNAILKTRLLNSQEYILYKNNNKILINNILIKYFYNIIK